MPYSTVVITSCSSKDMLEYPKHGVVVSSNKISSRAQGRTIITYQRVYINFLLGILTIILYSTKNLSTFFSDIFQNHLQKILKFHLLIKKR